LTIPVTLVPLIISVIKYGVSAPASAWIGFGYISIISQFLAFFAWYHGMAIGGIAKVSQVQLLQPLMTIVASSLLLGESISYLTILISIFVLLSIFLSRKTKVSK
jgi:drug/metabolite transporter (DMT)-like permease